MQKSQRSILAALALLSVHLYRNTLRLMKLPSCRFLPSCSAYAQDAIARYGAVRGGRLALHRLLRCQPLARGGFDPVE